MPSPVLDTDPNGRAGAHSVQVLPLHPKFPLELSCGQLEDHTAPGQELPAAGGSGDRLEEVLSVGNVALQNRLPPGL